MLVLAKETSRRSQVFCSTAHPHFTDTRLIWTPHHYGQFALSLGKESLHIRAVYTRENKPWLTLAVAYIRRERNHLYEYGLY